MSYPLRERQLNQHRSCSQLSGSNTYFIHSPHSTIRLLLEKELPLCYNIQGSAHNTVCFYPLAGQVKSPFLPVVGNKLPLCPWHTSTQWQLGPEEERQQTTQQGQLDSKTQTISVPGCDNSGLYCSFHGSWNNHCTRSGKEAGVSRDTAWQQQVVCHETASQGEPGEGMRNWQCMAPAQTGAPRGAVSFRLGEIKKKRGLNHDSSWCSCSFFLMPEGTCSSPASFFSSHLLPFTRTVNVIKVAEHTVGGQWPGHRLKAAPCPGLAQHSQHVCHSERSGSKISTFRLAFFRSHHVYLLSACGERTN